MRSTCLSFVIAALITAAPLAQSGKPAAGKTLDIYVIDVEGGKTTLFVTPAGETVLLDSANPGQRDQDRMAEVFAAAGIKQIDYLVTTHYHIDHIGGMQALAKHFGVKLIVMEPFVCGLLSLFLLGCSPTPTPSPAAPPPSATTAPAMTASPTVVPTSTPTPNPAPRTLKLPPPALAVVAIPHFAAGVGDANLAPWVSIMKSQGMIRGDVNLKNIIVP